MMAAVTVSVFGLWVHLLDGRIDPYSLAATTAMAVFVFVMLKANVQNKVSQWLVSIVASAVYGMILFAIW
ncbi:MAG TPA: hypothetical protein VI756_00340 [Blastocatellia bacterium]